MQVINTIDNRTEYHLTKVWLDGNGEETAPPEGVSVSFQLLRLLGGEPAGENPAAVFTLDGIPDEQAQELEGGIFYQETAPCRPGSPALPPLSWIPAGNMNTCFWRGRALRASSPPMRR